MSQAANTVNVSGINRERLLRGWQRARQMMADAKLPDDVRAHARRARDHAELALMLLDTRSGPSSRFHGKLS